MGNSVNKVIIVGNLGRDPEIRLLNNGDRVATLKVATSEIWKDKATGKRKEKTEWHTAVCFNDNITKVCEYYLKKGSTVYLEGKLQTRKYEQNGVEKYTTEIVLDRFSGVLTMIGGKPSGESFSGSHDEGLSWRGGGGGHSQQERGGHRQDSYDLNDDVPF